MARFLDDAEIREIVTNYITNPEPILSTQALITKIPELKDCKIQTGKVSDSIFQKKDGKILVTEDNTPARLMHRTPRVSTHDIGRGEIPLKDQVLAINHNFMRRKVAPLIGTSQFEIDGLADNAVVVVAEDLGQIGFENVIRSHMAHSDTTTSLYYNYITKGVRDFCGHQLPEGLKPNQELFTILHTPSTKSDTHDMSVSPQYLFDNDICTPEEYAEIRDTSMEAYELVSKYLYDKGIIVADTKLEHGLNQKGIIVAQDEMFTLDSSRFWMRKDYEYQLGLWLAGEEQELKNYLLETQGLTEQIIKEKYTHNGKVMIVPKSYSKEFARGMSVGDKGYTPEQSIEIAVRYIDSIQKITGQRFEPDMRPRNDAVIEDLQLIVDTLGIKPAYSAPAAKAY
ncbi:MAG: phosphoribosylaminoimidazolesuccinocarboxamide synthase [Candidatus Aenigmarchaeota archaeon]|nr:phosphoribosylaminoimidazolesuccinocarboxamide synthase [Candidatus Aenigmarchaeota archaeon]